MRYSIQEMKNSGYTFYELIDTQHNCDVVGVSIHYDKILKFKKFLEINEDLAIYYNGEAL